MVDIKKYVDIKNQSGTILGRDDIHKIFLKLSDFFDCRVKGFVFTHSKAYPTFITIESKSIFMNYDSLIKFYFNVVSVHNKDNKYDNVALINYYIVFALIHEFIHGLQHDHRITPYKDVNALYDLCFEYISNDSVKIRRILNNVLYQRLHDYFAIEINANVLAYEYMFYIVRDEYRDYFMHQLYELVKQCYMDFNLYDMYRRILRLEEVDSFKFDMSTEDKIRNGVFLSKDERIALANSGSINLAKVIDCKMFKN